MKKLTPSSVLAQNLIVADTSVTGRVNLFSIGVNTPQPYVAFLCASFLRLCAVYHYGGLFWALVKSGWLPIPSISTPLQPVAHAVESMIGGLLPSVLESPL